MLLSPEGASMETLKVSTKSNPNSVAGAMAGAVRNAGAVEVQVVGAGALNQAIKAVAIARGYVAAAGIDLVCIPTFADIMIDGERRTAIRLSIEDRASAVSSHADGSNNEMRNGDLPNSTRYAPAAATLDTNHNN
jgi:stage V sporulation protein S